MQIGKSANQQSGKIADLLICGFADFLTE